MMVSFSIKAGDQNDEIESPNLVKKTEELTGEYQSFFYFLEGVLRNLKWRGLLTDLQQDLKELLAGFYKTF